MSGVRIVMSRHSALQFAFAGFFFGLGGCYAVLCCTLLLKLIEAA